ncbi:hypothetical protein LCGC14_1494100, partial [marine sediment metagenome]
TNLSNHLSAYHPIMTYSRMRHHMDLVGTTITASTLGVASTY